MEPEFASEGFLFLLSGWWWSIFLSSQPRTESEPETGTPESLKLFSGATLTTHTPQIWGEVRPLNLGGGLSKNTCFTVPLNTHR